MFMGSIGFDRRFRRGLGFELDNKPFGQGIGLRNVAARIPQRPFEGISRLGYFVEIQGIYLPEGFNLKFHFLHDPA
jgi:hypothetical protein